MADATGDPSGVPEQGNVKRLKTSEGSVDCEV